jgi:hypothetical protein
LIPTSMCLQLADQSVRYPSGITENVPVKIWEFLVQVDFVVLDMHPDSRVSLILGRPFLSTANECINVGRGEITFEIDGKEIVCLQTQTRAQHQHEQNRSRKDIIRRTVTSEDRGWTWILEDAEVSNPRQR